MATVKLFVMDGNAVQVLSGAVAEGGFKSGSRGYRVIGKVDGLNSAPYVEFTDESGSHVIINCPVKDFKTGSVGYLGSEKVTVNGKRYQGKAQFVLIGSGAGAIKRLGYYQYDIQLVEIHSKPGMAEADAEKDAASKAKADAELAKATAFKARADKRMAEAKAKAAKRGVPVQKVLNEETLVEMPAA